MGAYLGVSGLKLAAKSLSAPLVGLYIER